MFNFLKKKKKPAKNEKKKTNRTVPGRSQEELAVLKGNIGEHKIDIQLSQLPKDYRYINDLMVKNPKSKTGYSQIDHVIITPYGIFVIETKNYQGTIYGGKDRKTWLVNGKFKFMNPFYQNYGHIKALAELIGKEHKDHFVSVVSFTKRCTFKVEPELRKIRSDQLIVYDIELTEFLTRKVAIQKSLQPEPFLTAEQIEQVHQVFQDANITDERIREGHVQSIKKTTDAQPKEQGSCVICSKPVSAKAHTYCLSNKRFNGKVYCFEHQKQVTT